MYRESEAKQSRVGGDWRYPEAGLLLSFFELGVRTPGGLFWSYGTPGISIFGVFRTPSLPIFGVIFGLIEATKMYKLF